MKPGSGAYWCTRKEATALVQKAKACKARKDYCQAIRLFTKAAMAGTLEPKTEEELNNELVDCWKNTVRLNPESQNHCGLAHAFVWGERFDEAEAELQEALRLERNNDYAKQLLAYLSTARKESKPRSLVNEGVKLHSEHHYSQAIEKYHEALITSPGQSIRSNALLDLGIAYHAKGDHLSAARYYAETLLIEPGDRSAIQGIQSLVAIKIVAARRALSAK